ncbi:MAG: cyclic peptide transporter [Cyclobacteriaceae bacterium]|jgi:cyclic peptide transporter
MNFLSFLKNKSKFLYVSLILLGGISSVFHSGILIVISNTIAQTKLPYFPEYGWVIFLGLILISYLFSRIFQIHIIKLTQNTLFEYEVQLLDKLRRTSHQNFEKIGRSRVYTAIGDIRILGQLPENFINIFNSSIVVLCCIGYMLWNSVVGGVCVLVVMSILLIFYLVRNRYLEKELNELRDLQNDFYKYLGDFLSGFKELKMSILRNDVIFNKYLSPNRNRGRSLGVLTGIKYMNNELTGNLSWYLLIGITLFVLPKVANLEVNNMVSFVVTILYLMGPVATLIVFIPTFTRAKIAIERINELDDEMDAQEQQVLEQKSLQGDFNERFESLKFEEVEFEYQGEGNDESNFSVGPINLKLTNGQVVFVTGGNGSGKSTFINILTGLYIPVRGKMFYNDIEVTRDRYPYYSDKIASIFSDNHLFLENYNEFDLNNNEIAEYLEKYQLNNKVKVDIQNNCFEANLSRGQQKRLAMVLSLLEDKEIIVLDEWAAEQDPEFRNYFYTAILPELKERGKTVIAITHDDAYFGYADRIIKFDYGKIVNESY